YGPSSSYSQTLDYASFTLSDETIAVKLPDLYQLMILELDRLLNGDINKYEFARAKGFILGSLQRSFQLPEDLARFYRDDFVYGREFQSPDQVIDIYRDFDIDSILATAKRYIQPANSILTVVDSHKDLDTVFTKL
ncbi:insulinase family protein, partial [Candidatus Saccharibacteria bacterium]|nr:insulinase family protein [Candidatus Saccharibacteria bacterium]